MKLDWFAVFRDVLVTLFAVFLVAYGVVSVVGGLSLGAANLLVVGALTVVFCVIACLKAEGRFPHLAAVAAGVWILGTVLNSTIRGVPSAEWGTYATQALVGVALAAGIGGIVSLAIVRGPSGSQSGESTSPEA